MSNKESLTLKEKLYHLAAVGALGSIALTGCASNVGAEPSPTSTSTQSETPTAPPVENTPTPSETETAPSDIVVDYASFANWDSITTGANPVYEHQREGSKEYICDNFFASNGLVNPEFENAEQSWTGEQIIDYIQPRIELAWQLNLDTSDDQNGVVAKNVLECLTSRTDSIESSDAYYQLSNVFDSYRGNSMQGDSPALNMDQITRESVGTWNNGSFNAFVVEHEDVSPIGDTIYPVITFEWSQSNDFRLSSINNYVGGDDVVVWGTRPPVVIDPSRADAPYNIQ